MVSCKNDCNELGLHDIDSNEKRGVLLNESHTEN